MKVALLRGTEFRAPVAVGAAAILCCLVVGIAALTPTQLFYAVLAGLVLVGMVAARSFDNLLILYIWIISLVHLFKRAIFLLGPQSQMTYYSVLFLPTLIYAPILLMALPRIGAGWNLASTRFLIAFVLWCLVSTLFPVSEQTWRARLAAVHERILPMLAFGVGLAVPLGSALFARMSKAIAYSAGVSVVYGVLLFLNGPTVMEREWARGTAAYSLQGEKVREFVLGGQGEWRGFSYYADPMTWGLFLVAAVAAALVLSHFRRTGFRPGTLVVWLPVFLLGLFVCLTRTPWVGLVAMVGTYAILQWRLAQRPTALIAIILAGFVIVVVFGTYLLERVSPMVPTAARPIVMRYSAVGTLGARVGAWEGLKGAVVDYPVRGAGFAENVYFARSLAGVYLGDPGGHNFLMETTVSAGVPGLALLVCFLMSSLREGTRALRGFGNEGAVGWLVAFVVGYIMTGYLSGGSFMNVYFFTMAGVLAAASLQRPGPEEGTWRTGASVSSSSATRMWSA